MSLIKFTATNSRYDTRLSVSRNNGIGLPTQFYKDENVSEFKYVILYYDPEDQRIALRLTNDENEKGRFSITKSRDYGGTIVASSFFRGNKIDASKVHGKYDFLKKPASELGLDEAGELYVIQLKNRDSNKTDNEPEAWG